VSCTSEEVRCLQDAGIVEIGRILDEYWESIGACKECIDHVAFVRQTLTQDVRDAKILQV
jgi:hypothetical protein